jgi:adenosylmethionine-8-amino-7-oxononanoate aminotransferase
MLFDEMYKGGLLFRVFGTKIIFTPPLCIAKSEIEEIVTITERIIGNIAKSHGY